MDKICFATLALGKEYIHHACILSDDLQVYAKDIHLIVLTDGTDDFVKFSNVDAYSHKPTGNWYCYHDKFHVIKTALEKYETVIFLDADCRLIDHPPVEQYSTLLPGIYGHSVIKNSDKLQIEAEESNISPSLNILKNTPQRRKKLLKKASSLLGIDFNNTYFIHESMIIIKREQEQATARKFLAAWDYLAKYFSFRGYEWGEGETIGLAAEFAGWDINHIDNIPEWLFKDLYSTQLIKDPIKITAHKNLKSERQKITLQFRKKRIHQTTNYIAGIFRYLANTSKYLYETLHHKKIISSLKESNRAE